VLVFVINENNTGEHPCTVALPQSSSHSLAPLHPQKAGHPTQKLCIKCCITDLSWYCRL